MSVTTAMRPWFSVAEKLQMSFQPKRSTWSVSLANVFNKKLFLLTCQESSTQTGLFRKFVSVYNATLDGRSPKRFQNMEIKECFSSNCENCERMFCRSIMFVHRSSGHSHVTRHVFRRDSRVIFFFSLTKRRSLKQRKSCTEDKSNMFSNNALKERT